MDESNELAKNLAGDKNLTIIGSALTTQFCLNTNLIDELYIDNLEIELERVHLCELPVGKTQLKFRFVKNSI